MTICLKYGMLHWNCEINWNYDKFKLWDKVEIMTLKLKLTHKIKIMR